VNGVFSSDNPSDDYDGLGNSEPISIMLPLAAFDSVSGHLYVAGTLNDLCSQSNTTDNHDDLNWCITDITCVFNIMLLFPFL
jgi:hypothetical protein